MVRSNRYAFDINSAPPTPPTPPSPPGSASIRVETYNNETNQEITGMWVVLKDSAGNILQDGVFSPHTFAPVQTGKSYIVEAHSFGTTNFARWDNGFQDFDRSVVNLQSNQVLKAYYNVASTPPPSPPGPAGGMGTVIFAYFGYDPNHSVWKRIFAAKAAYPRVHVIVVANPSNGTDPTAAWVRQMTQDCHARGIDVIGYIGTGFSAGVNRVGYVKTQAKAYRDSANVDGVFLDETDGCGSCSNSGGAYQQMADYCRSIGMKWVVGNPGGACNSNGQDRYFDIVCMWENPNVFSIEGMRTCAVPRAKKAAIPHNQTTRNLTKISQALDHVSYYYEITQFDAWHVYNAFPAWFEDIIRIINEKLG